MKAPWPSTPPDRARDTIEALRLERGIFAGGIYWALLIVVVAFLGTVPWVKVDLPQRASAVVRPEGDTTLVRAPVAGIIESVWVQENDSVELGTPLIRIRNEELEEDLALGDRRLVEIEARVADLTAMLAEEEVSSDHAWRTGEQAMRYASFIAESETAAARLAQVTRALERARSLRERDMIPAAEYEEVRHDALRAQRALELLHAQARTQWEADLGSTKQERAHLSALQRQREERQRQHEVTAPAAGDVLGVKGLSAGQFIAAGDVIATISPDTDLRLEARLSASAAGFPAVGAPARIQLDPLPASDWGYLEGVVTEVAADVQADANGLWRRVTIIPATHELVRSNGAKAPLRKGMTATVWILGERRPIWSVLSGHTSNWLKRDADP
ncbi:MAG: HlyD family secretion protein [Opitutales bacterium]